MIFRHLLNMRSHPTWVRGLKHFVTGGFTTYKLSHPTWVRGLKQALGVEAVAGNHVAPYVGAWIETHYHYCKICGYSRTLRGCVD